LRIRASRIFDALRRQPTTRIATSATSRRTPFTWFGTTFKWFGTPFKWFATPFTWFATPFKWFATQFKWFATQFKWFATPFKGFKTDPLGRRYAALSLCGEAPLHTKMRISFNSRSLSRISAAFSKSRFFAASFISFVRRAIALSRSSPSVRSRRAFEVGPPGTSK
jgi:hypothetical protein